MSDSGQPPKPPPLGVHEVTGRISKYEIVSQLGKGAMGIVYRAHDTVLDRDVALKVMAAGIAEDLELKQRFEREARAVARMTHPNIVTVFDLGWHTDGSPFIAMELLRGQDLSKLMRQGAMALDRIVSILAQVLAGLNLAHQSGIVHRDIKPANIFINQDGSVKIMDFGVARLTTASMTGTGNVVGTADYMSPEQVKGAKVDGRSDVFSVGCMFYEMLAGRRPFHADNLMAIFYRITNEEPDISIFPDSTEYGALIPILRKALAKKLEDRYQKAYDFMADLREYLRTHAASSTAQHALESLLDIEAPPTPPPPITGTSTQEVGATEIIDGEDATAPDLARTHRAPAAGASRTAAGTRRASTPTVLASRARGTAPPPRLTPTAQPRQGTSPMLYVAVGALAVALVAVVGYVVVAGRQPAPPSPTPSQAQGAAVTPTPLPTAPPPPTPEAQPTFSAPQGKSATNMRAAQAAFSQGDYDRALASAQAALREDPGNAEARRLADSALNGQRANKHFRAADAALSSNDLTEASTEAQAGRDLAPWDARGTSLLGRVQEAEQRAREAQAARDRQAQAQAINSLLNKADAAVVAQRFDQALKLYDEVLKLDGDNAAARAGRTGALGARAAAQVAANAASTVAEVPRKRFVTGKTSVVGGPQAAQNVPAGFEADPEVTVHQGTQAAEAPGSIAFEVTPPNVRPGDSYTVSVVMINEGNSPLPLASMQVATTINGRKSGGQVGLTVAAVPPRGRATILQQTAQWKEDTTSWSMEVVVKARTGEIYSNTATWR
jgi:serine/threonine protein kinase